MSIIKLRGLASLLLILLVVSACSKNQVEIPEVEETQVEINFEELVMSQQEFLTLVDKLEEHYDPNRPRIESSVAFIDEDGQVAELLAPLVVNGTQIHNEFKSAIYSSPDFTSLSVQEQNDIRDDIDLLTDQQLAQLSFAMNLEFYEREQQVSTDSWDSGRIRSCASFALGIQGIKTLITNTTTAGTVTTMIGALKHIGKRYLGWIGVGLMVWDFVDCMNG